MNFHFKIILTFILILFTSIQSQEKDKVVAKVGADLITESEFKERFDFSVHPNLNKEKDEFTEKHKFLEELIAEKLLSLDAQEKGYDTLEAFRNIIDPLQNIFVRDALYKIEVKDKAIFSQDDLAEGIERIKKVRQIKFIYSKNIDEINKIYKWLLEGASFDSLLSLRNEKKEQQALKEITFGAMDKTIEDSVYNLQVGRYTTPLASADGYYILKLINIKNNPNLKSNESALDEVKKIVEARADYKAYLNYYRNFFIKNKVAADKDIFESLIKYFVPAFQEKYSDQSFSQDDNKISLSGNEVTSAINDLDANERNKNFIKIKRHPIKTKYFLNQLSQEGFYVKDLSELSIRASLSSYIRKFIEDELLTIEGNKKKLYNSPEVKKYLDMWKVAYLSKMLMMNIFDSLKVSEEEAYNIYKQRDGKNIPLHLVNIAEVLTDSLGTAEKVLNELSLGIDIRDLAKQYSKRDSFKGRWRRVWFFPRN